MGKKCEDGDQVETQVLIEGRHKYPSYSIFPLFPTDEEYYQIPEFSSSCRGSNSRVRYRVEDVLVGAQGGGRKIGGDVKKCVAGLTCK